MNTVIIEILVHSAYRVFGIKIEINRVSVRDYINLERSACTRCSFVPCGRSSVSYCKRCARSVCYSSSVYRSVDQSRLIYIQRTVPKRFPYILSVLAVIISLSVYNDRNSVRRNRMLTDNGICTVIIAKKLVHYINEYAVRAEALSDAARIYLDFLVIRIRREIKICIYIGFQRIFFKYRYKVFLIIIV